MEDPHAVVMLRPWIDVGGVGSLVLSWLEILHEAQELGKIAKPGAFFDFTRYRPVIYFNDGCRQVAVPNAYITYSTLKTGRDFLFLHLLEPHHLSEVYVNSVLKLLSRFGVKRYCLIGSMYDLVPHTRPLLVTGMTVGEQMEQTMNEAAVEPSDYEGPTTITFMIPQLATRMGLETVTLIVHLPQYTQLEEDYAGFLRLMQVLSHVYQIPVDQSASVKAEQQIMQVNAALERDPQLKAIVQQLETRYDSRSAIKSEPSPRLNPEIESFIRDMGRRLGEN